MFLDQAMSSHTFIARGAPSAPAASPMSAGFESLVGQAEFPAHPTIHARRVPVTETILLRAENGGGSVPHAAHQDHQCRLGGRCRHIALDGELPHRTWPATAMDASARNGDHAGVRITARALILSLLALLVQIMQRRRIDAEHLATLRRRRIRIESVHVTPWLSKTPDHGEACFAWSQLPDFRYRCLYQRK